MRIQNIAVIGLLILITLAACAGIQTQHQKIATACEGAATAADAIATGVDGGRVSKAQAEEALRVYRTTTPFCEPEPVPSINSVDYAALITAAAQLTAIAEKSK
jgi:uncharacterized protein involved in response to NO